MDEYQEVIWNTLDDYHQRLWAPTVGMHGPWNDYDFRVYREGYNPDVMYFKNKFESEDKEILEKIIAEAYKIEEPELRKKSLKERINWKVEFTKRGKAYTAQRESAWMTQTDVERGISDYFDR